MANILSRSHIGEMDLNSRGFGLSYKGRDTSDTRSELGARFNWRVPVSGRRS